MTWQWLQRQPRGTAAAEPLIALGFAFGFAAERFHKLALPYFTEKEASPASETLTVTSINEHQHEQHHHQQHHQQQEENHTCDQTQQTVTLNLLVVVFKPESLLWETPN